MRPRSLKLVKDPSTRVDDDTPDLDPEVEAAESAFTAFLGAAGRDSAAAEALAYAYGRLPLAARERLLTTITENPGCTPHAVAVLLAVERDPELVERLATHFHPGLRRPTADLGYCWGSDSAGGILIVRVRAGFHEAHKVEWTGKEFTSDRRSSPSGWTRETLEGALALPTDADDVGVRRALDGLARSLWRAALERGSLPDHLRPVADLL